MEIFLIKALQLLLSLSILVVVHEFGHFLFARIFKVRVEKFYLFFDPWFSLFKFKPKNSDTEYGIGWVPLGGYCKISGMIDESMDKEQMAQPPQPYEFRTKPAWQRLLIMIGGVLFNFVLATFIYSMVLFTWGEEYVPFKQMKHGMYYSETFHQIGFRDGDIPVSADGEALLRLDSDNIRRILNARTVTVVRDGAETAIDMPADVMQRLLRDKKGFADPNRFPMVIREVMKDSPAARAGLQPGDSLVSVDGQATPLFEHVRAALQQHKNSDIALGFYRNGTLTTATIRPDTAGTIGVGVETSLARLYGSETRTYGFFESFPAGIQLGVNTLKGYVSDMKYVFTREGASSIGGFGAIGNLFPAIWDWQAFWMTTALLSIMLAFMNILPIPALDGGHVMFLLYEVVTRRKPSDKFLEYAQIAGMVILFGLLIYANGNDLLRAFFN